MIYYMYETKPIHSRTCVYNINYHVVWSVKYRAKVLTPDVESRMREIASSVAAEKGFTVHLFETGDQDHVHCFLSAKPDVSVSYMVKMLKGITARKLFLEFPELKAKLREGGIVEPQLLCGNSWLGIRGKYPQVY